MLRGLFSVIFSFRSWRRLENPRTQAPRHGARRSHPRDDRLIRSVSTSASSRCAVHTFLRLLLCRRHSFADKNVFHSLRHHGLHAGERRRETEGCSGCRGVHQLKLHGVDGDAPAISVRSAHYWAWEELVSKSQLQNFPKQISVRIEQSKSSTGRDVRGDHRFEEGGFPVPVCPTIYGCGSRSRWDRITS